VGTFVQATGNVNMSGNDLVTLGQNNVTDYQNVNLGNNATLKFTANNAAGGALTLYHINNLSVNGNNVTLNFIPGDYWINTFNISGNGVTLNVNGPGTARIYVNSSISWQQNNLSVNATDTVGSQLFVYDYNSINFGGNNLLSISGVFYVQGNIVFGDNNTTNFTGVLSGSNITVGNGTTINYSPNAVANMDFGSICGSSNYFKIIENNQGSYCQPQQVQVQAKNGTSIVTNYNKTVILNTQTGSGTWSLVSGSGTLTQSTPDSGTAQYQFVTADSGQATFNLSYTHGTSPVTVSVTEQGNSSVYDDGTQGAITFSPCSFKIIESSQGTFCLPQSVIVKAMSGSTQITNYTGAITLSTTSNKGTWSLATGNGAFTDATPDDGLAQYQFVAADGGQATFNLTYTNGPSVITVDAVQTNNSGVHDDGTQGTLTFLPMAFVVTSSPLSNPLTTIPASYSTTQIAGNSNAATNTLYVTAYGLNPNNSVCGIIQSYTGSKNLQFWSNYLDPSSGTLLATINGNNISASASSPTILPVTFTNGQASVLSMYPDVGKIAINMKDTTPTQPIVGATAPFVVKPASFSITVPNSPNPAPVDATGAVFTKAGTPFTVQVKVLNSLGNVAPNYGNECNGTNPCTPNGILLSSAQLIAPSGGRNGSQNNGAIANGSNFTRSGSGQSTLFTGINFSFDEVGIIQLTASVAGGSYLGAGNVTSSFGNVGRFIPYNFQVTGNIPKFNAGCVSGGFTYLDQPFSYSIAPDTTITALAFAGTTTTNYTGSFWKLTTASLNPTYTANQTGLSVPSITPVFVDHGNGTGDYTFDTINGPGQFKFTRTAGSNTAPFNGEIQLTVTIQDTDGVAYGNTPYTFTFGSTQAGSGIAFNGCKQMYHGRINLGNAYGPELSSLPPLVVPFTVQYYSGSNGFVTNTTDSCTIFNNNSNITLQPTPSSLSTTATVNAFTQGIGNLTLTRPNAAGYVNLQANLSALPWLQYAWPFDTSNTTGQFIDNPQARVTFGIYAGTNQIIYEREVYQ
jgi:hypothetical protein